MCLKAADHVLDHVATCLQVFSHLGLADLTALLATSPTTVSAFREALVAGQGRSEHAFFSLTNGIHFSGPMMIDLVCCVLDALLGSGLMPNLGDLVRSPQSGGKSLLSLAADSGRPDVVRWLLRNMPCGPHLQQDEWSGTTPLHFAALGGHSHVCEVLLGQKDAVVDVRDRGGLRPLHLAAEQGHLEACMALLEAGAHPDGPEGSTDRLYGVATPALLAAQEGHSEICALLVTNRADPLAPCLDGRTPLSVAREAEGGSQLEMIAALEAALWPDLVVTKESSIRGRKRVLLKGPEAQELIQRTMRQR